MLRYLFVVVYAIWGLGCVSQSYALDIAIREHGTNPLGYRSTSVYLTGPIVSGDAEKFWNTIRVIDFETPGAALHVTISSPGGAVTEALKIGRVLNNLPRMVPVTISTQVGVESSPLTKPGDCASACVLIYLGGTYRYLADESRIGVHQFSFNNSNTLSADSAASASQLLAADVTEYLRKVEVDPNLFTIMSQTFPDDIHWIDHSMLKALHVVNEHISEESSEYKNAEGAFYLLLHQQSFYGENKIVAACNNGQMLFIAYLQPPSLENVANQLHELTLLVDGYEFIPSSYTNPTPTARFAQSSFTLNAAQLAQFAKAKSVGARMKVPGAPIFFGFEMELPDRKLFDTISGCR